MFVLQLLELCGELTELTRGCTDAVLSLSRGSSPPLDEHTYFEVEQMASLPDAVRSLEDTLSQHQYLKAVQLLRTTRKQWKGEDELGSLEEEDDVDCLFFIYSRYVSDRQEGESSFLNEKKSCEAIRAPKLHMSLYSAQKYLPNYIL